MAEQTDETEIPLGDEILNTSHKQKNLRDRMQETKGITKSDYIQVR
jgi:hypothetical protein